MWNVKKTINTEKGSVLTLTALLLPVLFAFMGIAYDLGYLYMQKTTFQNIADAATLAGLEELKDPEKLGGTGKLSFPCQLVQLQILQLANVPHSVLLTAVRYLTL